MKKIFLIFLPLIAAITTFAQGDAIRQYIDTYRDIAINEMMRTGVPAAITLAQGIVESKAGQSDLVKASNNHFGIKCKDEWTGDKVFHDDDQKNECFRVYQTPEESFRDHSDFLKNRPYYTDLFYLDPADYRAWAQGLKKDGYATERDYTQMLCKMIEDYNLEQYSLIAMERMKHGDQATYVSVAIKDSNAVTNLKQAIADNTPTGINNIAIPGDSKPKSGDNTSADYGTQDNQTTTTDANTTQEDGESYPGGIFTINGARVVFTPAGTSLLAVASNYNVDYKALLGFNELGRVDILKKDMLIYLEKKPKKGGKDYHIVASEETIEEIAQKEGVRLESLLQFNLMHKGLQPATGEKIYLRGAAGCCPKLQKGQVS